MRSIRNELDTIKNSCLVFDIETSAFYSNNNEISIRSDFESYVAYAKVKWFGAYSYKYKKTYYLNALTEEHKIKQLLSEHNVLVGFNSEDFDYPIIVNNNLTDRFVRYSNIDCMAILGTSNQKNRKGYPYKNRGKLMDYDFKSNSLKCIAETMKLEVQKGDIDYKIFQKDSWTEEETLEIKKYLGGDVLATKGMFDKLWNYWMPFTELLDEKSIYNLSWVKNSIASLTYKSACYFMGVEPTYSEKRSKKEEMGGRVIMPKCEEKEKVWYVDVASLYPHIMSMFNLFAETSDETGWHGNDMFEVKGYYDISKWHILSQKVAERLEERARLKEKNPDSPLIYTLKIWLNALYGVVRSSIFEQVHTPNAGWDICWLGQQIHEYMEKCMEDFGFKSIMGDTDSHFLVATKEEYNNKEYVISCLQHIVDEIKSNVPFPVDTFKIDIEDYLEYLMCPFSEQEKVDEETRKLLKDNLIEGYTKETIDKKECIIETASNQIVKKGRSWVKERKGKKKNYVYLVEKDGKLELKIIGLPIKKSNATALGIKIFKEVLEPEILVRKNAKFSKEFVDGKINEYLDKPDVMELIAREYRVNSFISYKRESQIQAQISKGYFGGEEGIIQLIKNNKIGNAGKGKLYCTIQEAIIAKLKVNDLDLGKLYNELQPFIQYEK